MSDEERDVDVESDEEDDEISVGSTASTQFMTQAEKRAHHNALERKRRDHIKESFSSLREAVPALAGDKVNGKEKASRAQILKKASDYIQYMRRKNHTHQQDIDDLRKQNHLLEQQIRGYEKAKTTGQYATGQVATGNSNTVNSKGGVISAFDGGSDSESSETDGAPLKRKRLKTSLNSH
ncbi:protein max-like [Tubulanus polymorphus]|uniref:protein max-like n=1 Tax=Tubulanus polymorphus TaxID=672921 RepID=UPI003DA29C61